MDGIGVRRVLQCLKGREEEDFECQF